MEGKWDKRNIIVPGCVNFWRESEASLNSS